MAIFNFKDDVTAQHFEMQLVQDVKVNGTSVFDGEEANIRLKTINNEAITGRGNITAETTNNKVTSISSSSTDAQYPSAKCVYDIVGDIESLLQEV